MLNIATWNILLESDEFNANWGNPLSIANCPDQHACVTAQWVRLWNKLDELQHEQQLQVVLLQEVEDGFLQSQPDSSNWMLARRSGECAILVSSEIAVHRTYELDDIPGLSGCPAIPMAVIAEDGEERKRIHVGSLHLKSSIDLAEWFASALPTLSANNSTLVLGGDYNENLTDINTVHDWLVLSSDICQNTIQGTSQKEYNWIGNFDGFVMHSGSNSSIAGMEHAKPRVKSFFGRVYAKSRGGVLLKNLLSFDGKSLP